MDIENMTENESSKPSYCPHCGCAKPLTERYCPQCGKDRSGEFAPCLARAYSEMKAVPEKKLSEAEEAQRMQISGRAYAIAALVISLFNLMMFATLLTPVTFPLVIAFVCVSVKRKGGKTGMAVAALIISVISAIVFSMLVYAFAKVYPDLKYMADHGEEIVREYDINGTVPERFDKYRDQKYDRIWSAMGYDDFDDFFGNFVIEAYRKSTLNGKKYSDDHQSESTTEPSSGNNETTTKVTTSKQFEEDLLNVA